MSKFKNGDSVVIKGTFITGKIIDIWHGIDENSITIIMPSDATITVNENDLKRPFIDELFIFRDKISNYINSIDEDKAGKIVNTTLYWCGIFLSVIILICVIK